MSLSGGRTLLSIRGLCVDLGGRRVLSDVSIEVRRGEFIGLIGSNGAGKTTLMRAILGDLTPAAGQIAILGRRRVRAGEIGYVPQKIGLDPDLPLRVKDFVALGLDGHCFGAGMRGGRFWSRVDAAMRGVGAGEIEDRPVGRLSGGQQQRVLVAAAIVSNPSLLLLDEPLANLDPANSADIVQLLDGIRQRRGISVILSAHDINPLLGTLDRVMYLAGGRAAVGRTDEVIRTDVLSRLYRHPIEVLRSSGRVLVLADEGEQAHHDPREHMRDDAVKPTEVG